MRQARRDLAPERSPSAAERGADGGLQGPVPPDVGRALENIDVAPRRLPGDPVQDKLGGEQANHARCLREPARAMGVDELSAPQAVE
ncbi:hypothetical protein [Sorangium sp. So ce1099]|uniref:hypothetical protein n=1 Tax=Sorangium sp. So ce1099 TaxID=3133331 RepID=UPI003F5DD648